jgi:hypothetical protein
VSDLSSLPPILNEPARTHRLGLRVQCQRSSNSTVLETSHETSPGSWRCPGQPYAPGCDGGESYVEIRDASLLDHVHRAFDLLGSTYGQPLTATRTLAVDGEHPESVYERYSDVHLIYLVRDSNGNQKASQIGHECFHRWCTPPGVFHWVHEMLAEMFKVDLLVAAGLEDYADLIRAEARREAAEVPVHDLRSRPTSSWTGSFYGRALVTGMRLREAVEPEALQRLARVYDQAGRPDADGWLATLSDEKATVAAGILTGDS